MRTRFAHGGWENTVEGHPDETRSFATKSEAVHAGMAVAYHAGKPDGGFPRFTVLFIKEPA